MCFVFFLCVSLYVKSQQKNQNHYKNRDTLCYTIYEWLKQPLVCDNEKKKLTNLFEKIEKKKNYETPLVTLIKMKEN